MKRIFFIVLICSVTILNAGGLIAAKDARRTTNQETVKLEKYIMDSANGKKAFKGLIKLFNKNIAKVSAGGYYDSWVITYMNKPDKISEFLKPLSKKRTRCNAFIDNKRIN